METISTISTIQFSPDKDIWKNLNTIRALSQKAAMRGSTLTVFPELSLSPGWFNNKNSLKEYAQSLDGYQTQHIQDTANLTDVSIVFGFVEIYNGEFFNSAAIVAPNNRGVICHVRKHNLSGFDYVWASPEYTLPMSTAIYQNCRVGLLIGDDVSNRFTDDWMSKFSTKFYNTGDVDLVCVLDARPYESIEFPHKSWFSLAKNLNCTIAISNRVGTEISTEYGGGSCIIDSDLRIWSQGSSFTEAAIVGGILA